jgi:hypothetical protein
MKAELHEFEVDTCKINKKFRPQNGNIQIKEVRQINYFGYFTSIPNLYKVVLNYDFQLKNSDLSILIAQISGESEMAIHDEIPGNEIGELTMAITDSFNDLQTHFSKAMKNTPLDAYVLQKFDFLDYANNISLKLNGLRNSPENPKYL